MVTGGGEHLSKTFSIFYMLNSKNRVFNPYFSIGTCPMRKTAFVDKSRVEPTIFFIEKIPFSLKLFSGPFYGHCPRFFHHMPTLDNMYTCTVRSIRTGSLLLLMFPVLSCVRCDASLYRFLIVAFCLTLVKN